MKLEDFVNREKEIQVAVGLYPEMEVTAAYRLYKEAKGEQVTLLSTSDKSLNKLREVVMKAQRRPCTQPGCPGQQLLEGVCEGCVEGKKGYKSKWTCEECLYRELSKTPYMEILQSLTKEVQI